MADPEGWLDVFDLAPPPAWTGAPRGSPRPDPNRGGEGADEHVVARLGRVAEVATSARFEHPAYHVFARRIEMPPPDRFPGRDARERRAGWNVAALHEAAHALGHALDEAPGLRRRARALEAMGALLTLWPLALALLALFCSSLAEWAWVAGGICAQAALWAIHKRALEAVKPMEEAAAEMAAALAAVRLGWCEGVREDSVRYVAEWLAPEAARRGRWALEQAKASARIRAGKLVGVLGERA